MHLTSIILLASLCFLAHLQLVLSIGIPPNLFARSPSFKETHTRPLSDQNPSRRQPPQSVLETLLAWTDVLVNLSVSTKSVSVSHECTTGVTALREDVGMCFDNQSTNTKSATTLPSPTQTEKKNATQSPATKDPNGAERFGGGFGIVVGGVVAAVVGAAF
ncbi:hypothetical protein BC829DRAFT_419961 [Chytridium lagenaria]|nr:hypothetical protein BC829DRAFT_419961 [Chytridium lagenaria]